MLKTHWQAVLWTVFIFIICSIPGSQIPKPNFLNIPNLDKWAHLILYTIWAYILSKSYHNESKLSKKDALVKVVAFGLELGGTIEIYQHYLIPNRSGELLDFVADAFGVALGIVLFLKIQGEKAFSKAQ